jgi:hypothetical protein
MTTASWMRDFVTKHKSYKHDSVVPPDCAYDLMMACKEIGEGTRQCPEIMGKIKIDPLKPSDGYGNVLRGKLSQEERSDLMNSLVRRALKKNCSGRSGSIRGLSPIPPHKQSELNSNMMSRTSSVDGSYTFSS